jgi:hypothetical protein
MTMPRYGDSDFESPVPRSPVTGELLGPEGEDSRQSRAVNEQWVRLLSYWTDSVFEVPGLGWRFGLDPLIGLVPVVGDLATTALSFYILSLAAYLQLPRSTLARMGMNVAIDYVVGSVPLVGNVFDFAWKANQRNVALLERALAQPPAEQKRQSLLDWLLVGGIILLLIAGLIGSIALAIVLATWIVDAARSLW